MSTDIPSEFVKGLGKWPGIGAAEVGVKIVQLEIMDRTTGATGAFTFVGPEFGWGLPVDLQVGSQSNWTTFRTHSNISLRDFQDFVRFPSAPFGLFETIQFTTVDVKQDGFWENVWYNNAVDIRDLTSGASLDLSEAAGALLLIDLRWADLDPEMDHKLKLDDFREAFKEALLDFVDLFTTSELPAEAGTTPQELDEFLEQQSLPDPDDPVAGLERELEEQEAQASLLDPDEVQDILESETSWLPEDAPTEWGAQQTSDYLAQVSNVLAGTDPLAALDHSLAEEQAAQSLLTDHELAELDAQQSLLTDQALASQQAGVDHELAEEQAGQSLVTEQPAEAGADPPSQPTDAAPADQGDNAASGQSPASAAAQAHDAAGGTNDAPATPPHPNGEGAAAEGSGVSESEGDAGSDQVSELDHELAELDAQMSIEPEQPSESQAEGAQVEQPADGGGE